MKITPLTSRNLSDMNKSNQPFEVIGKIKPTFINGKWSYTEELLETSYLKTYQVEDEDYSTYIDNEDKVIFLAYSNEECVGQIVLKKDWNQYAFVEDICVSGGERGKGVGTALIENAIVWAKSNGLGGLALETQDNNVLACRFYAKCGFVIGAVNTMLYKNFQKPDADEVAILWYSKF